MSTRRDRPRRPWFLYALAVVAIAVAGLAITEIGAPANSARTSRQVVSAAQGVVQSTVTGSGNVAAGTDVNVNFNTSGTLQDVYVDVGQHVNGGQFLADLDPTAAQLSLDQAKESLTAAEDNLSCVQGVSSDYGSGSGTGTGSGTASGSGGSSSTTSDSDPAGTVEYAAFRPPAAPPTARTEKKTSPRKEPTRTVTVTVTVPNQTRPATSSTTSTTSTPSPGSIASAQAAVYSAQAGVHNAEAALNNTKLYAPVSGTIAWLSSLTSGDAVSGGGSGSSSSSGSSSGTTAGSLGGSGGAGSSGSSGSGSSGSSGSGFAEIVNTDMLTMTVAFSESDISKVHVGQPATVSLDALAGVKLAAHVSSISLVGTTSSSVVSYDATLTLDQNESRVKPGMSASASVVVSQAQGVTVPNQAVTGSGSLATVNLLRDGETVSQQVVLRVGGAGPAASPKLQAAFQACGARFGVRAGARVRGRFSRTAVTKYVTCVRRHGYNLPNPNFSGTGPVFPARIRTNAKFQAASHACQSLLVPARPSGPGGGTGTTSGA